MLKNYRSKRFYLPQPQSPTHFNLAYHLKQQGWLSSSFQWQASFTQQQLEFDAEAAECLEFKHTLAYLLKPTYSYIMPETYCINDKNWPQVLTTIAQRHYLPEGGNSDKQAGLYWILKPALLNNGQHIRIFSALSDIEQYFLSTKRLGGEQVLQLYINDPHLLRGHKYSIRMFVVTSNYKGNYIYSKGYMNVALKPYAPTQFYDLRPHLTNEHLIEDEANVVQIPSERFEFFPVVYKDIKDITTTVVKNLVERYPLAFLSQKKPAFTIYGFDFMVDDKKRVWLLEVNHGPCFPVEREHPLQPYLYDPFWSALIHDFIEPLRTPFLDKKSDHFDFLC